LDPASQACRYSVVTRRTPLRARAPEGMRPVVLRRVGVTLVGHSGGGAKSAPMENETRFERWLDRAIGRAATPRRGAEVIAAVTTVVTVGSGLLMAGIDHKNFPTLWLGLWWAVQTVTTVGYGDHVPTSAAGMLVAVLVMLLGIAFLSVITAAITS